MDNIVDALIFDRTQVDVNRARYLNSLWDSRAGRWRGTTEEWTEWTAGPRGAYGFADMNRVEWAVSYLTGRLEELGYSVAAGGVTPAYYIRVGVDPVGGGSASGGGTFYRGEEITVIAHPGEKYDFAGWVENGSIASNDPSYTFTVERTRNLTAAFALKQFRVDVSVEPPGSGEASGAGVYDIDTEVTVAALSGEGYAFTRWTEDGETVAEGPEYTFTLDRDRALSAVMTRQYVITATANNVDFGTVVGAGKYLEGQTVTLSAVAASGHGFSGWQENGTIISTDEIYTFIADSDRAITAVFVKEYVITLDVYPAGYGAVEGAGTYLEGELAAVTATAGADYRFVSWQENGAVVSSDAGYSFTVTGDRALTAVFEEIPVYVVTLLTDPLVGGTAAGGGSYTEGESVALTQSAADGYRFQGWYSAAGELLSADSSYTFTASENVTISARFKEIPIYTVTVSVDPAGGGTVTGAGTYREGEQVTVSATVADGYTFSKWTVNGAEVGTDSGYTFTVTGDTEVVAMFQEKASRLPSGYREVEHVETVSASTPISYVNTGINQSAAARYLLDIEFGAVSGSTTYTYLYTDTFTSGSTKKQFSNSFGKSALYYRYGLSTTTAFAVGATSGRHIVEIDIKGNQIKFDEQSKTISSSAPTAAYTGKPIKLGAPKIPIKWFSVKFYKDDSLVSDLVPCINSEDSAGFYDLVRDSFYALTGTTGTIAPGPAV